MSGEDWFIVAVALVEAFYIGRIVELWKRHRGRSYVQMEPSPWVLDINSSSSLEPR